jgi:hypothetical protein
MKQIIILLFSILLISCGTRKVAIQEIKKDSLSQISTKIETNEISNLSSKNNIIVDEFIITPLDSCKDIVVNGVTYKNVVLRHINTKDNSLHIKQKIVSKIEDKQQIVKTSSKENKKDIERKSFPYWLLLIPIALYIIYKYLCFLYPPLKNIL